MKQVNIHAAKTHLSRLLAQLKPGESITICKHNKPVAELRSLAAKPGKKRVIGLDKGKFEVPDSFFDPMPREFLDYFEGKKE